MRLPSSLGADLEAIVAAAIRAVQPEQLLAERAAELQQFLLPAGRPRPRRIVVVGAGKAAAGMAAGVETLLHRPAWDGAIVTGLVSVPEGSTRLLEQIEVRATRPAGANLPTPRVVEATRAILAMLAGINRNDLAIVLISGGGSALLSAPREGVSLEETIAATRFLSAQGADIGSLNQVRRAACAAKAGGLARACGAGRMLVLVLSDVIGDPLDTIASGPCMPAAANPAAALAVLETYGAVRAGVATNLVRLLHNDLAHPAPAIVAADRGNPVSTWTTPRGCCVEHIVLGSNATAVEAAAAEARRLGYDTLLRYALPGIPAADCTADSIGIRLADEGLMLAAEAARRGRPLAVIEGGEATVTLPADHGVGGRNQQTVLVAVNHIAQQAQWPANLLIASLGTDGEDGPTDSAGAVADAASAAELLADRPALSRGIARCDSLPLLERAGGLIRTGPTGTNVADVRILLAGA
jgi:glycerate-2-kinase